MKEMFKKLLIEDQQPETELLEKITSPQKSLKRKDKLGSRTNI